MNKLAIQAVEQHIRQAILHLDEASNILGKFLDDDAVYQVWCLVPVSGAQRVLSWLKTIKTTEGAS